jgi:hypothetical protein
VAQVPGGAGTHHAGVGRCRQHRAQAGGQQDDRVAQPLVNLQPRVAALQAADGQLRSPGMAKGGGVMCTQQHKGHCCQAQAVGHGSSWRGQGRHATVCPSLPDGLTLTGWKPAGAASLAQVAVRVQSPAPAQPM